MIYNGIMQNAAFESILKCMAAECSGEELSCTLGKVVHVMTRAVHSSSNTYANHQRWKKNMRE